MSSNNNKKKRTSCNKIKFNKHCKSKKYNKKKTKNTLKQNYKNKHKKNNKNNKTIGGSFNSNSNYNCSPKPSGEINDFSCYTNLNLVTLKNEWNIKNPNDLIKTNVPREIHQLLKQKLQSVCTDDEKCWLKQTGSFNKMYYSMYNSFAPKAPKEWKKNLNEWLSSDEIINVMKQYERAYKCFQFLGPTPIDFDKVLSNGNCVFDDLCLFDLQKTINNGKTKIGIIFNTDPHNKPGQHWISLFINVNKKIIFYFDSTGDKMPNEILNFSNKVIEQGKKLNPPIEFKLDSSEHMEHQKGNTECGMYSLFFIINMLQDKLTEEYIKTHRIKDKYVEQFRKVYFNL